MKHILIITMALALTYQEPMPTCNQEALDAANWELTESEHGPRLNKTYTCSDLYQDDDFTDAYFYSMEHGE